MVQAYDAKVMEGDFLPSPFLMGKTPANDVMAGTLPLSAPSRTHSGRIALYKNDTPTEADTLYELGWQYLEQRHYDQAIAQFNRVLQINQNHPDALNNLGHCLLATGRVELALKTYQLARFLAPHDPAVLRGIANCFETQGNFSEARALYKRMLKQEPHNVEWLYNLVLIGDYAPDTSFAGRLKKLHHSPKLPIRSRILVCFALAKIYESHGENRRAFTYYEEGNRLEYQHTPYDEAAFFQYLDMIEAAFDARLFAELSTLGSADATPIFVLGMPRSGTSLVEQILASHPQVHGAGELNTLPDMMTRLIPQLTGSIDPHRIRHLNGSAFASLAGHYLNVLRSHCADKPYIIDKMPNNIFSIGLIRLLFPRATIIHCVRDPMDTCWSLYRQRFSESHYYSYDQGSLGRFYLRYQQLMRHWHRVLPGAIYDVDYEQLVHEPRQSIAALLQHCGLSWDDACFDFHRTQRSVSTASMRQVRRPIYKDALQSWKSVADQLVPLREALGYQETS